jgi:hypothetical protein
VRVALLDGGQDAGNVAHRRNHTFRDSPGLLEYRGGPQRLLEGGIPKRNQTGANNRRKPGRRLVYTRAPLAPGDHGAWGHKRKDWAERRTQRIVGRHQELSPHGQRASRRLRSLPSDGGQPQRRAGPPMSQPSPSKSVGGATLSNVAVAELLLVTLCPSTSLARQGEGAHSSDFLKAALTAFTSVSFTDW